MLRSIGIVAVLYFLSGCVSTTEPSVSSATCPRPQAPDDRLLAPPPEFVPMTVGMTEPEALAVEAANNQSCRATRDRYVDLQRHVKRTLSQ